MSLILEEANQVINGTVAKTEELYIKINATVYDAGGRLIAFARKDGAIWAVVYESQGNAVAQARFCLTMQSNSGIPLGHSSTKPTHK